MGKAMVVDGGGSPLSAQIIFSAIDKKKKRERERKTMLYLLKKERAYRALWPGALASPLPLCTNL